jgi:hypothetical protein
VQVIDPLLYKNIQHMLQVEEIGTHH